MQIFATNSPNPLHQQILKHATFSAPNLILTHKFDLIVPHDRNLRVGFRQSLSAASFRCHDNHENRSPFVRFIKSSKRTLL